MTARPEGKKVRGVLPLEVASFLRAPYGWTSRMRRGEGHPARGERHPTTLGFWTSLMATLATYGPVTVGALLGWRGWGGWGGAGLGALLGLTVQVVILVVALPVIWLAKSRRSR